MNFLKIISVRELDETFVTGLQNGDSTCLEQNTLTDKASYASRKGAEKLKQSDQTYPPGWDVLEIPKPNIYITARNATTVEEIERLVKEIVQATKVDIRPFQVSTRHDVERLGEQLDSHLPCKVLCCVDSSARNIILSPNEPDEATHIVDAAMKVCGKNGVFLLLRGHRGVRDDELYDERQFNTSLLGRQPKLQELAEGNQFVSMYSSLNKGQERAILNWIYREPDNITPIVKPRSDSVNQCGHMEGNRNENFRKGEGTSFLQPFYTVKSEVYALLTRVGVWATRSRQPANKNPCTMEADTELEIPHTSNMHNKPSP